LVRIQRILEETRASGEPQNPNKTFHVRPTEFAPFNCASSQTRAD
jgi:hypothetical protein